MPTRFEVLFSAALLVLVAGCSKQSSGEVIIDRLGELKRKMCACKDGACTETVNAELQTYREAVSKQMKDPKQMPDAATLLRIKGLVKDVNGCRDQVGAGERDAKNATVLQGFDGFADKMCKCTDKACADQVSAEMQTWTRTLSMDHSTPRQASDTDAKHMADAGQRMIECQTKAMTVVPTAPTP